MFTMDKTLGAGRFAILVAALLMGVAALARYGAAQAPPPVVKTLYSFSSQNGDGSVPKAGLIIGRNKALYGTTSEGGANGSGSVFQVKPPSAVGGACTESVIYSFPSTPGCCGVSPNGLTLGEDGAIYGTTYLGGVGLGTVFELKPPAAEGEAWAETTLYVFTGQNGDGAGPGNFETALVLGNDGALYGTTLYGGVTTGSCATIGCGTVFRMTRVDGSWMESVLYAFTGQNGDGVSPEGVVFGEDGDLYGTTFSGGTSNLGTVFELAPPAVAGGAWEETVLHSFAGPTTDGYSPNSRAIIGKTGMLYGATFGNQQGGAGMAFQLMPPGPGGTWTESILFNFTDLNSGIDPSGLVLGTSGALFGTAADLGTADAGAVFELRPPAAGGKWSETILHNFTGQNGDGATPYGPLVIGENGAIYGTTSAGGAAGLGTVFELDR